LPLSSVKRDAKSVIEVFHRFIALEPLLI